uniref:Uncharacterized protein n=1 Tax=Cannabis sativa TaxID=3483 RepID=A0A803QRR0_CANSA
MSRFREPIHHHPDGIKQTRGSRRHGEITEDQEIPNRTNKHKWFITFLLEDHNLPLAINL